MVNIDKIKSLCKQKGIKLKYLCDQFGVAQVYLNDVAKGKNTMSEDRIMKCAEILGTSFEYLIDVTDDPEPNYIGRTAEALQDKVSLILASVAAMSDEEQEILHKLVALPDDERKRAMSVLSALLD